MSEDTILKLMGAGDQPMVFGIRCPYCQENHLFSALGIEVEKKEGEASILPTLSLVQVDEDDIAHVRCLSCLEVFGFICVVKVFRDPGDITLH